MEKSSTRFYLDYNATTPLCAEAREAMRPWMEDHFGNPSSVHSFGRVARAAVDEAREELATLIGAKAKEIIFTSGGTESNNLAILGAARARRGNGNHILTCSTEHHAVLHPCQQLEKEGFRVTMLPVNHDGLLDPETVAKSISSETILVSIMSANNETGVRQPIREIAKICRQQKVILHCDAVQSFGKETVNVEVWGVDLLSLAGHKFYGPKGIGLLWARTGTVLQPLHLGGAQENDRRAGTENVVGIVGLAAAARYATIRAESENHRLFDLTEKLWSHLSTSIRGIRRNGHPTQRLGNTLNVSFENCDGQALLMGLDLEGIAVSSGSACMVGSVQPSHVLLAMGVREDLVRATVRFSLGKDFHEEDLMEIKTRTTRVVESLRTHSE